MKYCLDILTALSYHDNYIAKMIFKELVNATCTNNISLSKCLFLSPFSFRGHKRQRTTFQLISCVNNLQNTLLILSRSCNKDQIILNRKSHFQVDATKIFMIHYLA